MLKRLPYKQLHALGVQVYVPRKQLAAVQDASTIGIVLGVARANARCLVITHEAMDPATAKIYTGMLSVLNLPPQQIMQVMVTATAYDLLELDSYIMQWQAEYILQLSMEMPGVDRQNWIKTYSPAYLLSNPQYKAQAYKTLLSLRAKLDAPSELNT